MTSNPERRLPLQGASNFRDLGGYATDDGRHVRWRKVFRSGALDRLTDEDLAALSEMGLRTICDLRHPEEQAAYPTRLSPLATPTVHSLPIRPKVSGGYRERIEAGDSDAGDLALQYMTEAYRCYVRDHTAAYTELMHAIADPANHPLVFHCAAGKDRTGFGAALILMTLGVPEETVFEDYLATNHYWTESALRVQLDIPEAARQQLKAANDVYLRAAIDTLHDVHETLDAYLGDALKMDAETIARFRALLLE
ncbi:MAG: tyrosine-protein phosphatase [Proteobacteria bacterium]|nr:tyrosine-protein phosphatase [Pseudomonadota bacterium]MDA1059920.1 tyrosine-protein phosphatase [Pseudomonadota bacterium]